MASNQFLYKPVSEADRNLAVLLPSDSGWGSQVSILDQSGNVLGTGRQFGENAGRPVYRFDQPGASYGQNLTVRITDAAGNVTNMPIASGGARYESTGLSSEGLKQAGGYTPTVSSYEGVPFVSPTMLDYASLSSPYVDYDTAMNRVRQIGAENKDIFFQNLTGGEAKSAALGLVQTDIEGITTAMNALAPYAREQSKQDLAANIETVREIDAFNLQRMPAFTKAGQTQVSEANKFAQAERDKAVEASGLDYKGRITEVLDSLRQQAKGRLPSDMDEALTTEMRNRGADITSASGISAISGAGVRAQDRLNILERIGIMQNAQAQIPGTLTTGQQVLSAQEERAPTFFAQPTEVPFAPSTAGAQVPLLSNISAGAAQQEIAQQVTSLQTLSPATVLSSNLQTQQFNEEARYNRDRYVLDTTQDQVNSIDTAYQNAINASRQQEQVDEILDRTTTAQAVQGGAFQFGGAVQDTIGSIISSITGDGGGTQPTVTGTKTVQGGGTQTTLSTGQTITTYPNGQVVTTGGGGTVSTTPTSNTQIPNIPGMIVDTWGTSNRGGGSSGSSVAQTIASNLGSIIDVASQYGSNLFGKSFTKTSQVGGVQVSQNDYTGMLGDIARGWLDKFPDMADPNSKSKLSTNENVIGFDDKNNLLLSDGRSIPIQNLSNFTQGQPQTQAQNQQNSYNKVSSALSDVGLDAQILTDTASSISSWDRLSPSDRLASVGSVSFGVLENKGVVSQQEAGQMRQTANSFSTIFNANASDSDKAIALANLGREFVATKYTGSINSPSTIGGNRVIGSTTTDTGLPAYSVIDQNGQVSTISRADLENSSRMTSLISAASVLTSNAKTEDKVSALAAVGVDSARAHEMITATNAGNANAALSLFNTGRNWDRMSNLERTASTLRTGSQVMDSAVSMMPQGTTTTASTTTATTTGGALSTIGAGLQLAGGIALVGAGIHQAADVIDASSKMPKSQSQTKTPLGGALAGASIGAGVALASAGAATLGLTAAGASAGSVFPVVGTAIGAAVGLAAGLIAGNTGSGKNTGQMMRDSWRGTLTSIGIASKDDKKNVNVELADGSLYNIGLDGNAKLDNVDGVTKRNTFDVDWGNDVAVNSIPTAHLFAIATGLDPTSNSSMDLFHRAVAQSINAATSNTNTISGVNENFRYMMDKAGIDPRDLGMQIESLRVQNKITEQEYGVYINQLNKVYGTQLQPTDLEKSRNYFIETIQAKGRSMTKYEKNFLEILTNKDKASSWARKRDRRLGKEINNIKVI